ncbi:hypothetical protein F4778DRAFT_316826 [Xylariomycetidae sp. FL2044]|nr:hypothetical protein F4778DRAFT_316826 [Xylariomycetidae sp. FL2044]
MASSPKKPTGFSLQVTVFVAPENEASFFSHFKPVFDKVVAEPECLFFEVYKDPAEPGRLSWVEDWSESKEWFMEHQITKSYYKDYLEATEAMFIKPREVKILDRAGPDFFMSKES